jgi:hypothetical protein
VNTQCSVQKLVGNRILSSVCCQVKVLFRIQAIGGPEEQKSTRDGATAFARATGPAVGKSTTENRRLPNLFENKRFGCCCKAPKQSSSMKIGASRGLLRCLPGLTVGGDFFLGP